MFLFRRQVTAGPVDIKSQHGHGGLEWSGFTPPAGLGRTLERARDTCRVRETEDPLLQVHCVTCLIDVLRPTVYRHTVSFLLQCAIASCLSFVFGARHLPILDKTE